MYKRMPLQCFEAWLTIHLLPTHRTHPPSFPFSTASATILLFSTLNRFLLLEPCRRDKFSLSAFFLLVFFLVLRLSWVKKSNTNSAILLFIRVMWLASQQLSSLTLKFSSALRLPCRIAHVSTETLFRGIEGKSFLNAPSNPAIVSTESLSTATCIALGFRATSFFAIAYRKTQNLAASRGQVFLCKIKAQWRCGLISVKGEVSAGPLIPTKMWADV